MLDKIEKSIGIKFPELYWRLYMEKMLDWGTPGPNWHEKSYPLLRKNPPLLLFAHDFKIIQKEEISTLSKKMFCHHPSFFRAIPFGKNGAGDLHYFMFTSPAQISSICTINRITQESTKLSKNLEDFIFQELLGSVMDIGTEEAEDLDFNEDLDAMLQSHEKYISKRRAGILREVYSRPFKEIEGDYQKLSLDEYESIVESETIFDERGTRFLGVTYQAC